MSKSNLPAIAKQYVGTVEKRVVEMERQGQIHLPENYSASNALRSAFLILQETKDKDKRPALEVCTQASITNALLDLVIQGLNPAKKQAYFLVYGQQLVCQRSYHGTMAVTRMVNPRIPDDGFSSAVVYEDDELIYEIKRGKTRIATHKQKLENIDKGKIKAAYCEIYDENDKLINSELMTLEQIKQSWKQSPIHPVDDKGNIKPASTHGKFTADMALKTVIGKACRPIINSSSDAELMKSANRGEQVQAESNAEQTAIENENQDVIDIEPPGQEETINKATGEVVDAEFELTDPLVTDLEAAQNAQAEPGF